MGADETNTENQVDEDAGKENEDADDDEEDMDVSAIESSVEGKAGRIKKKSRVK